MAHAKEIDLDIPDEPLDTRVIVLHKNGTQSVKPALHIGFMENRNYVHFIAPPIFPNNTGPNTAEEEEWLENIAFLKEDLQWILKLPYHRFWSQVIYDESLHKCLESYLSQSPRDYDLVGLHLKDELLVPLKNIHKLVFLVYLRMSTYKESKNNHMTPEAFGNIIYDNFIFDVPKLMDLSALYGLHNLAIVSKMVQNIFSTQYKYNEDLNKTSQVVLEAFSSIEETLSMNLAEMQSTCTTTHQTNGVNTKKGFSISSFHDFINYITDVSATLHSFLEVYPEACQVFFQNGAAVRIATFYENAFPAIEREVSRRQKQNENERLIEDIKRKVCLSKTLLIQNFRGIVNYCCIQNILNSKLSEGRNGLTENPHSERFLDTFTEMVTEKNFLHDYNLLYPFETDLELFNEIGIVLDPQRLNYIFTSIHDSVETFPDSVKSSIVNGARPKVKKRDIVKGSNNTLQNAVDILRGEDFHSRRAENEGPSEKQINSLIQNVLDVFPELGGGFIEKCLEHFHYDHERVIDVLITDSLPDHLISMNRNLTRETDLEEEECSTNIVNNYSVLSERKNIFDNDEFDIFSRKDVDMEKIHIGKKDKTPMTYESLTKDPESEFLKQLTLDYSSEEPKYDDNFDLYEDEYDDTYDSVVLGVSEPIVEGFLDKESADTEDQNEEPSEPTRDASKDFCMNPEDIRAKRQQAWESKQSSRGYSRGRGASSSSDQNRQNKDRNKARVGNHNRRSQSDWKKSRGMMPS
ncbi:hypothetical protein JTE90_017442 [Oedothorax gibbosus]|uniref:CUE domain-containing protein n=1 Tax=Oedothorax gibbosus TaxID=931172 RepID=A0AAV6U2C0_9ARAC|nr:hypothetical protein JTE90_017442 [Oedothorax gibbosus]